MYAIMGITGQVGTAVAAALLADGKEIRGIVRDKAKAVDWKTRGVEVAVADSSNATALEAAFDGAEGIFVMIPPNFAPSPAFPETRQIIAALRGALTNVRPAKVVYLSSIGAQHTSGLGLITQLHILEEELSSVPAANAFLRPGWFMENFQWDISSARQKGEFPSFLYPLERQIPMVATHDIGRLAAQTLQQEWQGLRHLEIEGPHRYSPMDAASVFSRLFQRPVSAVSIPRQQWASVFQEQGTPSDRTAPRIEMLDGFNSGWIEFEQQNAEPFKGIRTLEDTLTAMARNP
jgi:NAD(P)H dehydrogenase (quinone)